MPIRLCTGQRIDPIVLGVPAVAFDPAPLDFMRRGGFNQLLPKLGIFDRLFVRSAPAVALPIVDPARDAVANVDTVCVNSYPTGSLQCLQSHDGREQLHAVVGRQGFAPRELAFLVAAAQQGRPAAGTRVAATGPVGKDLDERRFAQATSSRGSLKVIRSGE